MDLTRRNTLALGAAALSGLGLATLAPRRARAAPGTAYPVEGGEVVVSPVEHASLVLTTPNGAFWFDPVGEHVLDESLPAATVVFLTHEHPDHFDLPTLEAILPEGATLVTNPAVFEMLPEALKSRATPLANGESTTVAGDVLVEAVPAYNITPDRLQFHPEGRDNGYVLTIGGRRFYVAGDTEDTPEMRALTGITVAFLPMNLPYTMDVEQAADAVAAFAPEVVYPYHYGESDTARFAQLVTESGTATRVVQEDWYPDA